MSVYVTMRVNADPSAFAEHANANAEVIQRIMGIAESNGLIAHRWFAGDGIVMAVDEWPAGDNFTAFMEAAQADIGPLMEAVGVTSPPEVTVWAKVDIGDDYGWGA